MSSPHAERTCAGQLGVEAVAEHLAEGALVVVVALRGCSRAETQVLHGGRVRSAGSRRQAAGGTGTGGAPHLDRRRRPRPARCRTPPAPQDRGCARWRRLQTCPAFAAGRSPAPRRSGSCRCASRSSCRPCAWHQQPPGSYRARSARWGCPDARSGAVAEPGARLAYGGCSENAGKCAGRPCMSTGGGGANQRRRWRRPSAAQQAAHC